MLKSRTIMLASVALVSGQGGGGGGGGGMGGGMGSTDDDGETGMGMGGADAETCEDSTDCEDGYECAARRNALICVADQDECDIFNNSTGCASGDHCERKSPRGSRESDLKHTACVAAAGNGTSVCFECIAKVAAPKCVADGDCDQGFECLTSMRYNNEARCLADADECGSCADHEVCKRKNASGREHTACLNNADNDGMPENCFECKEVESWKNTTTTVSYESWKNTTTTVSYTGAATTATTVTATVTAITVTTIDGGLTDTCEDDNGCNDGFECVLHRRGFGFNAELFLMCIADDEECDAMNNSTGCESGTQCQRKNPLGSRESDAAHRQCMDDNEEDVSKCFECADKLDVPKCNEDADCDSGYECVESWQHAYDTRCIADGDECDKLNDEKGCATDELCKQKDEGRDHNTCMRDNRSSPWECFACSQTQPTTITTTTTTPDGQTSTLTTTTTSLCDDDTDCGDGSECVLHRRGFGFNAELFLMCIADDEECDAMNNSTGCAASETCERKNPLGSRESDAAHRQCMDDNQDDVGNCFECVERVEYPTCETDDDCNSSTSCEQSAAHAFDLRCLPITTVTTITRTTIPGEHSVCEHDSDCSDGFECLLHREVATGKLVLWCAADDEQCDTFNSGDGCDSGEQCERKNPPGSFASDQAHRQCLADNGEDVGKCFQCAEKVEVPTCEEDNECSAGYECVSSFAHAYSNRCIADAAECDQFNNGAGCASDELCKQTEEEAANHRACLRTNMQSPEKCFECKVTTPGGAGTTAATSTPMETPSTSTQTASSKTSAEDPCNSIKCSLTCESECGWDSDTDMCVTGEKTSQSEIDAQMGDCPSTTSTSTKTTATATSSTTTFTTVVGETTTTKSTTTTSTTTTIDPCKSLKCAVICDGECGWSRAQSMCLSGLTTSQAMIDERLGDCPSTSTTTTTTATTTTITTTTTTTSTYTTRPGDTTSTRTTSSKTTTTKTTTTTQDPCEQIKCALFCDGECGWSRARDICMTGGTTSESMINDRLGDCPTTTTTTSTTTTYTTNVGDTTSTKTTQSTADPCNSVACSVFCTGACGWSRAQGLCISGISTGLEEISERLGDCGGLAKPTTLEPASDDANADASTGTGDAANKADSSKLTIIIAAAAGAVVLVCLIAVVVLKSGRNNGSGSGEGAQAFSNPMYAASEPHYGDDVGAESSSAGYMDVNVNGQGSSGYMDVGGTGYNMDMSDA